LDVQGNQKKPARKQEDITSHEGDSGEDHQQDLRKPKHISKTIAKSIKDTKSIKAAVLQPKTDRAKAAQRHKPIQFLSAQNNGPVVVQKRDLPAFLKDKGPLVAAKRDLPAFLKHGGKDLSEENFAEIFFSKKCRENFPKFLSVQTETRNHNAVTVRPQRDSDSDSFHSFQAS
jgi:hypothetical protein